MFVTLSLNIPDQLLLDTLVTAVEGGSNYWLIGCEKTFRDGDGNYLALVNPESVDGPLPKNITPNTITDGIIKLFTPGVLPLRSDLRLELLSPEPDLDAEAADILLQLGVFGELVYG